MPNLLIGILIVGFGTSAPEIAVSDMAATERNPALALGNALGSNIVNISLILGIRLLRHKGTKYDTTLRYCLKYQ